MRADYLYAAARECTNNKCISTTASVIGVVSLCHHLSVPSCSSYPYALFLVSLLGSVTFDESRTFVVLSFLCLSLLFAMQPEGVAHESGGGYCTCRCF